MSATVAASRAALALALASAVALVLIGAAPPPGIPGDSPSPSPSQAPREKHGSVTMEPGYYPAADPESASVRIGRRLNAPAVRKRFTGGARSLEDLGRSVCRALGNTNPESLLSLCVHEDEFRDIMWREFPQSRPATGITADDGWMFLWARLHGGSVSATHEYGGRRLQFMRFERYDSTAVYKNFKLHKGLVLWAKDEQGELERFSWFRVAVERKGRFKIYSMKD